MIEVEEEHFIEVQGARVHNLHNIDVSIPRDKLTIITGLSGSGKSSLAFDTIYAEGQRRYLESFASYARQFLGTLERPEVDKISGLSPVISIEQKTVSKNPRSTVGTITEVYDYLRLLFAKIADAYSYVTGEKMVKYTEQQIIDLILNNHSAEKVLILAPIVKGRKGHYKELFNQLLKRGFLKARVDGELIEIMHDMKLDRYKVHDIELVIDQLKIEEKSKERLKNSIHIALQQGNGVMAILNKDSGKFKFYSKNLMCPTSGIAYDDPAPNMFSFNSPYGACKKCNGLGEISEIDIKKIIPNKSLSIKKGAFAPLGKNLNSWIYKQIEAIGKKYDYNLNTPVKDISDEAIDILLYGSTETFLIEENYGGASNIHRFEFEGIINFIARQQAFSDSKAISKWAESFMNKITCPTCNGSRLRKEANYFKVLDKSIYDLSVLELQELYQWTNELYVKLTKNKQIIAKEVLKEINSRLEFLLNVGLDYLTLNRSSKSLSGGEAQRIRLATQIGSQLVNVLYILDEPSIGLHQRDNKRLINSLKSLRDLGNSIIVVEHDKDIMLESDYIIDIGPKAGIHGGRIVASGTPEEFLKSNAVTAKYLNNTLKIEVPEKRRKGNGKFLELIGANGNNLKNVDIKIPLGKLIGISGVSGSGKSSLINQTLYPILSQHFYKSNKKPLPYKSIKGIENIDKVIEIDQSPIGRTSRSNPATYVGVFTEIRELFAGLNEAKIRGYKPGRFSFNVKGGRCEGCLGAGVKTIEMNFLPDVYVLCNECNGKRYNRETLEVRYKGKSINDVLEMTVEDAVEFFENIPSIYSKLKTINEVGLGYIKLGQSSSTLSGGEAQRVKLAAELSKKQTGNTFYILDEPTTGLHFDDIKVLMEVIERLVDLGNTVLIIEHNLDVLKKVDYLIDIGPEGGRKGGEIIAEGTPEEVAKNKKSITGQYLKNELI